VAGDSEAGDASRRDGALVEIAALGDRGHGTRRLAGRQDDQSSGCWRRRQMRGETIRGVGGGDRGAEQVFEKGARRNGQDANPIG
jgi:hypothetical protein